MVSCIILAGPKRWCENHKKVIQDNGESWLLYDKFPINEIDTKHLRFFIQNGDFITCICITKQFGGNRNIEYIAYSPKRNKTVPNHSNMAVVPSAVRLVRSPTAGVSRLAQQTQSVMLSGESRILITDKNIIEVPHSEGEYYFDEELMKNYPGINPTTKKGFNIPVKSPGPCPSWEDYDFIDTKVKDKVKPLPRPYNVAIKITRIQALEVPLSEFINLRNESPINEGQLQKSFIIARTNNLSVENFRKNNRKS